MKNIYLYGASDDCCELETDFGKSAESYSQLKINDVIADYKFDGDWGIRLLGSVPETWKVRAIQGNCAEDFRRLKNAGQFIHIQIPDNEVVKIYEPDEDDEEKVKWKSV